MVRYESLQELIGELDKVLPESSIEQDEDGQVIVYTGLEIDDAGKLVIMEDA